MPFVIYISWVNKPTVSWSIPAKTNTQTEIFDNEHIKAPILVGTKFKHQEHNIYAHQLYTEPNIK